MGVGTKRPRIGFDATAAFTQGGGIGRYTRELLGALLREQGSYRFQVFTARSPQTSPSKYELSSAAEASIKRVPLTPRWLYRIWYRLRLPVPVQLFTGRIDLFHSPDFVLPPVMGPIPTLLTVHDLSFEYYPETFTPSLVTYLRRVVPWSVRRATRVLADSESTRSDLMSLYQTPGQKITVLYSGVNEQFRPIRSQPTLSTVRAKYGIGDEPYIFTVSTLQPRKNHRMLIEAFSRLVSAAQINLVIAGGKGWLYDEMAAEIMRLGLTERVHFLGFVDDEDLPTLYSAASLFVFPSLYEGFGLPILEAMACGTPVLASDASSLPEVSGDAALQLPPSDVAAWTAAMRNLLEDDGLRKRLVAAGFERAKRFTWERSARELLGIYELLLNARANRLV